MAKEIYKLVLTKEASDDIYDLYEFYESMYTSLGDLFMDKVAKCLNDIQNNPHRWQYVISKEDGIRRAVIQKPNAIVLYKVIERIIYIGSVHDSRSNWRPE